uniref:Uncharacterized protein n=1 Tax=Manihot esculenta TaxID=3983 RepID=A0A2C9URC5_MANES
MPNDSRRTPIAGNACGWRNWDKKARRRRGGELLCDPVKW